MWVYERERDENRWEEWKIEMITLEELIAAYKEVVRANGVYVDKLNTIIYLNDNY